MFIVDIENLVGDPRPCRAAAADAFDRLEALTPIAANDHVVIGAHTVLAASVGVWWPEHRLVTGSGRDAADMALIDSVGDRDWIAGHYDRLIIGSGDHIFVDTAAQFRRLGLVVGVVSRDSALSADLRRTASFTRTWSDEALEFVELAAAA